MKTRSKPLEDKLKTLSKLLEKGEGSSENGANCAKENNGKRSERDKRIRAKRANSSKTTGGIENTEQTKRKRRENWRTRSKPLDTD